MSKVTGPLFHPDSTISVGYLRSIARLEIASSPLIQAAAGGSARAAQVLHIGFWPFVSEFELAIDRHSLPREPLRDKFGASTNETFLWLAASVRRMKEEEGSHAAHWRKDAEELGITDLTAPMAPAVRELIDDAYSTDLPRFFSVLAGTEFIAEELSSFLIASPPFTSLFDRKRWMWGEVHLAPHDVGPSHLEIDLDLALAYSEGGSEAIPHIEAMVEETISLFGRAAEQINRLGNGA